MEKVFRTFAMPCGAVPRQFETLQQRDNDTPLWYNMPSTVCAVMSSRPEETNTPASKTIHLPLKLRWESCPSPLVDGWQVIGTRHEARGNCSSYLISCRFGILCLSGSCSTACHGDLKFHVSCDAIAGRQCVADGARPSSILADNTDAG